MHDRGIAEPADEKPAPSMHSAVPGFDQVLRGASGLLRERRYRLVYLSASVRVGPRRFTGLNAVGTC